MSNYMPIIIIFQIRKHTAGSRLKDSTACLRTDSTLEFKDTEEEFCHSSRYVTVENLNASPETRRRMFDSPSPVACNTDVAT